MATIRHCEICKAIIDAERAEALPETRVCREHANQLEKFGSEFRTTMKEVSLSKAGSMKGNRGDVSVSHRDRRSSTVEKLRDEYELGEK